MMVRAKGKGGWLRSGEEMVGSGSWLGLDGGELDVGMDRRGSEKLVGEIRSMQMLGGGLRFPR